MSEATEPAIPVIAPVPLKSLQDLLSTAARDWPQATQPGAQVAMHVDSKGVAVVATLAVHDIEGALLARRQFDGHWEIGGMVRWTPRQ